MVSVLGMGVAESKAGKVLVTGPADSKTGKVLGMEVAYLDAGV